MEAVIAWFNSYWWCVLIGVTLAAKVCNLVSVHYSERTGLKRAMLFVVDLLDLVKTTPAPGVKK